MTNDDPDAVWRPDDVPVPPGTEPSAGRRHVSEEIVFDRLTNENEPPPRRVGSVRAIIGAAIAAVVVVAAVVGVVVSGADESAAPSTTEPSTTEPSTAPAPITVAEPIEPTDAPTTTGVAPTTTGVVVPFAPELIELPAAVAAISAPTEVLVLSSNGLLRTLSLPSGRVRTIDLTASDASFVDGSGAIVVAPDAAAVGISPFRMVVVPRSGDPVDVSLEVGTELGGNNVMGWIRGDDGSTRFVVGVFSPGGSAGWRTVGTDGEAVELPEGVIPDGSRPASAPQGDLVVNDAGGAYRVTADGTSQRIEDGVVLAHNGRHRLVRECDESQRCSTVVVSEADGVRRVVDPAVLPDDFELAFGIDLSPDGSAASVEHSGPQGQLTRVIVDFDTGEVASVVSGRLVGSAWAADSSGVFIVVDGELRFLDRATGELVAFAKELGRFVNVGVRHPDAELPAGDLLPRPPEP